MASPARRLVRLAVTVAALIELGAACTSGDAKRDADDSGSMDAASAGSTDVASMVDVPGSPETGAADTAQATEAVAVDAGAAADGDGLAAQVSGYPCAVAAVIEQRCVSCHARPPRFGAPMPLLSWQDVHVTMAGGTEKVWVQMSKSLSAGTMPPTGMPDGERAVLLDWLGAGAPPGDCPRR
jgi:hypothetical protein